MWKRGTNWTQCAGNEIPIISRYKTNTNKGVRMKTNWTICIECGVLFVTSGYKTCYLCTHKFRRCEICGESSYRVVMVWDGSKDDAKDVGSDDYGWVCLVCDEARK